MKIRAIVDGNVKVGWYRYHPYYEIHQLMVFVPNEEPGGGFWREIEIDISTAAEATGKLDKHGDEIYGSRRDMQGGDRVKLYQTRWDVTWNEGRLQWMVDRHGSGYALSTADELEIIPPEEGGA